MHNSASLRCAQAGSPLPSEFSKSCDVYASPCDSQTDVVSSSFAFSSRVSLLSSPSASSAARDAGMPRFVLLMVLVLVAWVGRVVVVVHGVGWKAGFPCHSINSGMGDFMHQCTWK